MHISFNTENLSPQDIHVLSAISRALQIRVTAAANPQPQPEVGDNTGTSSTGITLSPGAAGVSEPVGSDAPGSAPDTSAPPAETTKRTRKPKEPIPAPTISMPQVAYCAAPAEPAAPAPKLTIDDVRAKLQAFTGAKGIDAGLALLGEFKAGRISELKAEDYPAFVAKCEVVA